MKTYKFKLYKSKKQKHLHRQVRIAGEIYNHLIALHRRYYGMYGKYINKFHIQKHISKLKKQDKYSHWKALGSQAIQEITKRIDFGYQKFFKKENKRPPSFRKSCKFKSFTLTQAGWKLDGDSIQIGKTKYRFWKSREILGNKKCVHIKRDTLGDFYIYIITDYEEIKPKYHATSGKSVGMDFGLKTYFKLSDETEIEMPEFFKQAKREITKANRVLSRKQKGSKSRRQARKQLARVHKQVANRRRDWQFNKAKELVETYGAIFLETLNIAGMKKLWGRKLSDLAFYQQVQILKHQASKTGTLIGQIDQWMPTTKVCNECGCITEKLTLNDRTWDCDDCGAHHDRDVNAAINIHNVGASTFGLGIVSRDYLANTV